MSEKKDYCQYYLDKCKEVKVRVSAQITNETIDSIRNAYESSKCFSSNLHYRENFLEDSVSSFLQQDSKRFNRLDADAGRVLKRAINRINNVSSYSDIFYALSDYLWVAASYKICENRIISLIDDYNIEHKWAKKWIEELKEALDDAEYDLRCMKKADKLSSSWWRNQKNIDNPDVAWYVDARNVSRAERKTMMSECRLFIEEQKMIYFAFQVTHLYREQLGWRYY